jgi:hypothetical protein
VQVRFGRRIDDPQMLVFGFDEALPHVNLNGARIADASGGFAVEAATSCNASAISSRGADALG